MKAVESEGRGRSLLQLPLPLRGARCTTLSGVAPTCVQARNYPAAADLVRFRSQETRLLVSTTACRARTGLRDAELYAGC